MQWGDAHYNIFLIVRRYFLFLREVMRDLTKAVRADQVRSESGDDGTHPQSRPPVRCSGAAVSEALTPVRN